MRGGPYACIVAARRPFFPPADRRDRNGCGPERNAIDDCGGTIRPDNLGFTRNNRIFVPSSIDIARRADVVCARNLQYGSGSKDMLGNEREARLKMTAEEELSKKPWRRPEVIRGKLDQAEASVLAGPEIIIYVS